EPVETIITINAQPSAPTLSGNNICFGETIELEAIGNNIQWYNEGNTSTIGSTNTISVPSTPEGNHRFEATQTVLGCTSERSFIDIEVYAIPEPPTVSSYEMCSNNDMAPLIAVGLPTAEINWYSDENLTIP